MKTCSKCNKDKSIDLFHKDKNSKDGLRCWCKPCIKKYNQSHHKSNLEKSKKRGKKWREINKEYNKDRCKKWLKENKESRSEYKKKYRKDNKESINDYKRKRLKIMMKNPQYKIETNLRKRLYRTVKKITNGPLENKSCTQANRELLGCSINELQTHLESKFDKKMTWDNYGKWHIDHIKPVSSFNLNEISEVKTCFHFTNLQPLWAIDNTKKGSIY